jgi:hypothetical protein
MARVLDGKWVRDEIFKEWKPRAAAYATRGLQVVLAAVARLTPAVGAGLRIHVFTTEPADVDRLAAELAVTASVRASPYVGYLEFLRLSTAFDCLIVNDAITGGSHTLNPYLPSKVSDYRGSAAPVWGLVEQGSPLSRQSLDFVSTLGDVAAAAEVLTTIVLTKARR